MDRVDLNAPERTLPNFDLPPSIARAVRVRGEVLESQIADQNVPVFWRDSLEGFLPEPWPAASLAPSKLQLLQPVPPTPPRPPLAVAARTAFLHSCWGVATDEGEEGEAFADDTDARNRREASVALEQPWVAKTILEAAATGFEAILLRCAADGDEPCEISLLEQVSDLMDDFVAVLAVAVAVDDNHIEEVETLLLGHL